MATLDEILRYHGDPGKRQIIIWLLLLFTLFHVGMVQQFNIMVSHTPKHHCKPDNLTEEYTKNMTNLTDIYPNSCSIYIDPNDHSLGAKKCENGYKYETLNEEIFVSNEFNLVCADEHWVKTTISISFVGVLIGGLLFGQLADRYGRRRVLSFAVTLLSILSTSVYFAPNLGTFIALRFLMGILSQGMQTTCLTYGSELFLAKMRTLTSTAIGNMWAIMLPLLGWMFYGYANWRHVHLTIGLLTCISAAYVWFLPESVSWLISKWRIEEATKILNSFAKYNGIPPSVTLKEDLEGLAKQMQNSNKGTINSSNNSKWSDLFKTPIIRRIILSLLYVWFTSTCATYGTAFAISSLKGNSLYVNYTISGCLEFVVRIAITYLFVRCGRVTIMAPVQFGCGTFIIVGFLIQFYTSPDNYLIQTSAAVIALLGRSLISVNFTMIVVFTSELTPVSLRSTGVGLGFAAARVGNIIVPYTVFLDKIWEPLPKICYGIMVIIAGCVLLTLPETFNKPLPNTIQDVENLVLSKRKANELATSSDDEPQLQTLIYDTNKDVNKNHQNREAKV